MTEPDQHTRISEITRNRAQKIPASGSNISKDDAETGIVFTMSQEDFSEKGTCTSTVRVPDGISLQSVLNWETISDAFENRRIDAS